MSIDRVMAVKLAIEDVAASTVERGEVVPILIQALAQFQDDQFARQNAQLLDLLIIVISTVRGTPEIPQLFADAVRRRLELL